MERAGRVVHFDVEDAADRHERIVQLVGVAWIRPRFCTDPVDGCLVERAEVVAAGVCSSPRLDGVAAPLFERRVVEERVRLRAEDLVANPTARVCRVRPVSLPRDGFCRARR